MSVTFILMTAAGAGLFWLGIRTLRTRAYEHNISLIEAAVLKITGSEPLPLSESDRAWGRASAWATVLAGITFFVLGAIALSLSFFDPESV